MDNVEGEMLRGGNSRGGTNGVILSENDAVG